MNSDVRWRLSVMMFLQYAIWGAWQPFLASYLIEKGFGEGIALMFSLLPLGSMIAPFVGGQLADRYVPTEKLIAVLHLIGGILLCAMATAGAYGSMVMLMAGWALVYAPTLALTNSITFHHLPDAEKKFGLVRVFGTFGWIAAGLSLTLLRYAGSDAKSTAMPVLGGFDGLWLGGILSLALGLFAFALPHTPPAKTGVNPWAFLSAIKLLRDPSFAIFTAIVFVVSTELQFYYVLTEPFLQSLGISEKNTPWLMTIAQIAEIGTMLALPWMLENWGVRKTMAVGIIAWPIRYAVFAAVFAYGEPTWLAIAALTLHGICYVCFFVVAYVHVNNVATPDIRASAQSFITFVALGMGLFMGSFLVGWIRNYFTTVEAGTEKVNYTGVFLVPCAITVLCAVVFFLTFREKREAALAEAKAS